MALRRPQPQRTRAPPTPQSFTSHALSRPVLWRFSGSGVSTVDDDDDDDDDDDIYIYIYMYVYIYIYTHILHFPAEAIHHNSHSLGSLS